MAVSEAQRRAAIKYQKEKCDNISTFVPKGQREVYHKIAKNSGLSLSQLVQISIKEFAQNRNMGSYLDSSQVAKTANEIQLIENFNRLSKGLRLNVFNIVYALANGTEGGQWDDEEESAPLAK